MRQQDHKRIRRFTTIVDSIVSAVLGEHDRFVPRINQPTRKGFLLRLDFSDIANTAVGKDDVRWYKDELTERILSMLEEYSFLMDPEFSNVDLSGWPKNAVVRILDLVPKSDIVEIILHFKISKIKKLKKEDFKKLEKNLERELIFRELQR